MVKGSKQSEEAKAKISTNTATRRFEVRSKMSASKIGNKIRWNSSSNHFQYYHEKAKQLFGSPVCQECSISIEEYILTHKQSFEMHCISKDFTILEQWNWKCLCSKCHHNNHKRSRVNERY